MNPVQLELTDDEVYSLLAAISTELDRVETIRTDAERAAGRGDRHLACLRAVSARIAEAMTIRP